MLKKIKIKIGGIHCKSCKILIETEVDVLAGVKDVQLNHSTGICKIEYDPQKISETALFEKIAELGYSVIKNGKQIKQRNKEENQKFDFNNLRLALILLALFAVGYYMIKHYGYLEILSDLNEKNLGLGLIFVIGLLASFHCVGMCGGLVVAYSATSKSKEKKLKFSNSHFQYNLGRLISYTVTGAVLGGFGSFFGVNPVFTSIMTLLAGTVMILMGLSLVTEFGWLNKIKVKTPDFIAQYLFRQKHSAKPKGPLVIGLLNGFMPCGPLQAMQLYALATGSILQGASAMAVYSLGTIPVMFGFGNFITLLSQNKIKQVMKISGVIVVALGVLMLGKGITNFSFPQNDELAPIKQEVKNIKEQQVVKMDLTYRGYVPNVLKVKEGIPVRWEINVKQMSGCTNAILIEELGIRKDLKKGLNVIEFTPTEAGEIKFSCWMKMVWGKFIVLPNNEKTSDATSGEIDNDGICDLKNIDECEDNG